MNYGATSEGENLYPSVTMKVGKLFIDPRQESTDGGHSWSLFLSKDFVGLVLPGKRSLKWCGMAWRHNRPPNKYTVRCNYLDFIACNDTRAWFPSVQLWLWTLATKAGKDLYMQTGWTFLVRDIRKASQHKHNSTGRKFPVECHRCST